jgi:CBS domain/BON domain
MDQRRVKRLPVVDREGKLIGIVSRADLLRVSLRPDAEIAAEASAVLTDVLLADPSEARATARDGVVTFAGRLASQDRAEAAVRLTEAINGVVAVASKLTAPPSENWPDAGYDVTNRDLARGYGQAEPDGVGSFEFLDGEGHRCQRLLQPGDPPVPDRP